MFSGRVLRSSYESPSRTQALHALLERQRLILSEQEDQETLRMAEALVALCQVWRRMWEQGGSQIPHVLCRHVCAYV